MGGQNSFLTLSVRSVLIKTNSCFFPPVFNHLIIQLFVFLRPVHENSWFTILHGADALLHILMRFAGGKFLEDINKRQFVFLWISFSLLLVWYNSRLDNWVGINQLGIMRTWDNRFGIKPTWCNAYFGKCVLGLIAYLGESVLGIIVSKDIKTDILNCQIQNYTNTAFGEMPEIPNICYIFE